MISGWMAIIAFIPLAAYSQLTDINGNVYKTVEIGSQIWMAENLRATKYNDGKEIPLVRDTLWYTLTTDAYCYYDNKKDNMYIYGLLYNWYVINTAKVCPEGWHIPSSSEWGHLATYLEEKSSAGEKLKQSGNQYWSGDNTGSNNESGFTALPGGARWPAGRFYYMGERGLWWSSSKLDNRFKGSVWQLKYNHSSLEQLPGKEESGFSVRCIKGVYNPKISIKMIKRNKTQAFN